MLYLNIFILSLSLTTRVFANSDACEMLPEYTCSDATLNDGTGQVVRNNPSGPQRQKIIDDSFTSLVGQYQRALTSTDNPPSNNDINIALSASGATLAPTCSEDQRFRNGRLNFGCARILALFLARRANDDIFRGEQQDDTAYPFGRPGLEDLNLMVNSNLYKQVLSEHNKVLNSKLDFTQTSQRVEGVFKKSLVYMNQFIDSSITDRVTRDKIKSKINGIRFEGVDCSSRGSEAYSLDSSFVSNAFYEPVANVFKYCNGLALQGLSDYHLTHIITHELAHSIDPCRIAQGPRVSQFSYASNTPQVNEYPFQVLQCLRSEGSVQAFDPNSIPNDPNSTPGQRQYNQVNGQPESNEPFCHSTDQINESFCDWMGSEVLARYMQFDRPNATRQQHIDGIASIWRPVCNDADGLGPSKLGWVGDPHPATRDRLQRITLAQPTIRRLVGCSPLTTEDDIAYCDHNQPHTPPSIPDLNEVVESAYPPAKTNQKQTPQGDEGAF